MTQLAALNVKITGDSSDLQSDLTKAEAGVKKVGAAATVAQTKTTGFTGGLSKLGNVSGSTRAKIQNTSFQLQDIAVQLQGGTRASTVFAQQLPQLLGGFGALGAVLGVVAGVGIPALAFAFSSAGGSADTLEDSVDRLRDALDKYIQASKNASMTTKELHEKFGEGAEGLRSTYELLEQIAANEAQRAIDGVGKSLSNLLGAIGDGESRTALADFFDVNIFLAFTDAQREAREEARLLTAQFQRQQKALDDYEGNLDGQIEATKALLDSARALANLKDGISETEEALIKQLAEALAVMQEQKAALEGSVSAARSLSDEMAFIASLSPEVQARMVVSGVEAGNIPPEALADLPMSDADKAMQKILERRRKLARTPEKKKRGGSKKTDPLVGELERLESSLMTEEELQLASFDRQQETLRAALEKKLLTRKEFNELIEDAEAQHAEKMAGIAVYKYGDTLAQTGQFMGDMASAMQSGNDKMLKVARVFGAAEALINSYRAYNQVIADPSLPWFAKIPAAVSVLGAGLGMVNAIKGVSSGGGSAAASGGASSASSGSASAPQTSNNVAISLTGGDMFSRTQVVELISKINDAVDDGAKIRLV
jgi:hypothetical protein